MKKARKKDARIEAVRLWDTDYHNCTTYICTPVFGNFTLDERARYSLDDSPTCPQFAATPAPGG